jgi:RNase P protein component
VAAGMEKLSSSARFYEAFKESVHRHGRMHEVELMTIFFSKTRNIKLMDFSRLGFTLWRKGKVSLAASHINIKRLDQIKAIYRKVEELEAKA